MMRVSREYRSLGAKHTPFERIDILSTCKLVEEGAGLTPAEVAFMLSLAAAENGMWFLAHQLATLASEQSDEWAGHLAAEFLKGLSQIDPRARKAANEITIDEIS